MACAEVCTGMKCRDCGNRDHQERLGSVDGQPEQIGYRCRACGRLYKVQVPGLDELVDRLESLQAKSAALAAEQERLAMQLDEIRAQIQATRGE